jgi:hypothetical protein
VQAQSWCGRVVGGMCMCMCGPLCLAGVQRALELADGRAPPRGVRAQCAADTLLQKVSARGRIIKSHCKYLLFVLSVSCAVL